MDTKFPQLLTTQQITQLLRDHAVTPTAQRVEVARVLFREPAHFSAEEVFASINQENARVSKATVYNTLGLFVEKGLVRTVFVDPSKVFYDSNTQPHHHFYDEDGGTLRDIDASQISVRELPPLPDEMELAGVDVIVRLRRR